METMNKYALCSVLLVFLAFNLEMLAQVGIGTTTPDASSVLDIRSTSTGMLIPRMTTAQRLAIGSPATGLLVFDVTTQSFWFYKSGWSEMSGGTQDKIVDANGDTRVEVEQSANEDIIHLTTLGAERMTIDDNGVTKIGDIANGHDTKIEADGTLMFEGDAEVWDDLRVSLDKGSSSASLKYVWGSSGPQIWYFRDNEGLEAMSFVVQLPHSWKEGTTIYPHIHWMPDADNSGNVEWNFDYSWQNYNATTPLAFPTFTTSTVVVTGSFTARTHRITALTPSGLNGTGKNISSILICKIWRNSSNSADTYRDDCGLMSLDFHFQIDTVGSRSEYTK